MLDLLKVHEAGVEGCHEDEDQTSEERQVEAEG
jgi:hypothetical protein